ncbi:UNVERIFIED_CONTAM: Trafficking protein particle complex subunit [Sesamum calycinum]|uniref:Trafficking protein particle complex subunit n=1 Tax=Sesamum calycinum TaxID=2727403 RepID=A0AAW2NWU7_9LAMI
MLAPFRINNIDVPVRTASDQPYRLRKFRLRLFYGSEVRQPNIEVRSIMEVLISALVSGTDECNRALCGPRDDMLLCRSWQGFYSVLLDQENCFWHSALVKAAKERLKQVITFSGDKDISELCSDPPDIESLIATSKQELVPSWFQNFNKELIDVVAFSEHEAFDHPVACLVVVSSKDKDPIDKFVDLFNTNQLPPLLNDGAMDPKILKYFLLVHDNQDGMLEKASGILSEMRSAFGANDCRLLCINSSADGAEEHQENLWASYKTSISNNKQYGCFLNADDIEELRSTMHDFSSKHIIPHMELKIRVLNQQVYFVLEVVWYTFSSIESQIRVLGDYAFMLRDYELALSNYRLISTDYKLDKAWKHYAGVQEMMGLAYFMLDQARKDAEYCMENAFTTYLKRRENKIIQGDIILIHIHKKDVTFITCP